MFKQLDLGDIKTGEKGDTIEQSIEKCNANFKTLSDDALLLENYSEIEPPQLLLKAFDVFKHNSKLLKYEYPDLRNVVNGNGQISPRKIFEPMSEYFKTLT